MFLLFRSIKGAQHPFWGHPMVWRFAKKPVNQRYRLSNAAFITSSGNGPADREFRIVPAGYCVAARTIPRVVPASWPENTAPVTGPPPHVDAGGWKPGLDSAKIRLCFLFNAVFQQSHDPGIHVLPFLSPSHS